MPFELTATKLKAFLIIDLIIFGAFTGTYFYVQGQIPASSESKPAEFVLSNMVIDPSEVYSGQAVVISLNTTNVGGLEGNQTLNLEINGVVNDAQNVTVESGESQIVQFTYIGTEVGNFSVKVGNLVGSFVINPAPPEASKIILSNLLVKPYEVWQNDPFQLIVTAKNKESYTDNLTVKVAIDGAIVQTQVVSVPAQTTQTAAFNVTAIGGEGVHSIKVNTLSGSYTIVKTGFHTLIVGRSGSGSAPLPFTVDGNNSFTPYRQLLPVGEHTISVPDPYNHGTAIFSFSSWNDGVKKPTRTIDLQAFTIIVTAYTLISGFASCPTLFVWDGTGYTRASEVSDGPGWLGNVRYYNPDGSMVFDYGTPLSYIKINPAIMKPLNGYYDMTITEQSDEIFYLDSIKLLAVDHSPNVDVYSTRGTYIYNLSQ